MDAGVDENLPVPIAVPLVKQGPGLHAAGEGVEGVVIGEQGDAPGDVGGQAGLDHLPENGVTVVIHIGHAGDPRGNHLRQPQAGAGGHGPVVQPGLGGENILVEPGMQVAAPAIAPHQGHGQVGVGVDQAGQEHFARPVDDPVKVPPGADGSHGGDGGPIHRHIGVLQHRPRPVHGDGGDIGKKNGHGRPFLNDVNDETAV